MDDERYYGHGSCVTSGTGYWNSSGCGSGSNLCGSSDTDGSGEGCGYGFGAAGLPDGSGKGSGSGYGYRFGGKDAESSPGNLTYACGYGHGAYSER